MVSGTLRLPKKIDIDRTVEVTNGVVRRAVGAVAGLGLLASHPQMWV